jgi:hypothetical protein
MFLFKTLHLSSAIFSSEIELNLGEIKLNGIKQIERNYYGRLKTQTSAVILIPIGILALEKYVSD